MTSFLKRAATLKKETHGNAKATTNKLKHFDADGARPSDVLSSRANQYKHVIKTLIAFYEAQTEDHLLLSKSSLKQSQGIPVPFHEGDQFIQEPGGLQHSFYQLRDRAKAISDIHAAWASETETQVLEPLNAIRKELATVIEEIDSDLGKTADQVDAERAASAAAVGEHSKGVAMLQGTEGGFGAHTVKSDPYISNQVAARQLAQQLEWENKLTKSTIHHQTNWKHFEERLMQTTDAAHRAYFRINNNQDAKLRAEWAALEQDLTSVGLQTEWEHFASPEEGRIVDPTTPLRDANLIAFPHQNHEFSKPVKEGELKRKKRYTKSYSDYYFVLTLAGFLHAFPSGAIRGSDPKQLEPDLSLYLPDMTLGPASLPTDKKHKFYLTGRKATAAGKDAPKSVFGKHEVAFTFKGRSHHEVQQWWDALSAHTRTALTVAESEGTRTPASYPSTVSNVGLPSTDAESGFSQRPYSSSFVQSEYSTTGTEHAPSAAAAANAALPSAIAAPTLRHEASQNWDSDGSSVEEEGEAEAELGTLATPVTSAGHPIKEVLVAAQGPSTVGEDERLAEAHPTPAVAAYDASTHTHAVPVDTEAIELPSYVGSSGYLAEKAPFPQDKEAAGSSKLPETAPVNV